MGEQVSTVQQGLYPVPDIHLKDLLNAIPSHCFHRSAIKSSLYIVWDCLVIGCIYQTTGYLDALLSREVLGVYGSLVYYAGKVSIWSLYAFWVGLFGTGLWVIGHECGHQAFSESRTLNDTIGWIMHSVLGVPYHSWRISHAKHHALSGHMTQDQVFVPATRSDLGLPSLDLNKQDRIGSRITEEAKNELREAFGDSPIGAVLGAASYVLVGWPAYITTNASGQKKYPKGTNHFNASAPMFAPHHHRQIMISTFGIVLWLSGIAIGIHQFGFLSVFRTYLAPYLWINHWLVLIVFLQHTDPLLPHYRGRGFTVARGALATLDRKLLGDLGPVMAWIGAHATHGISETHILHHVCSKIPHYNAWEASEAVRKKIEPLGIPMDGGAGGWYELYRVFRECRFVQDEGDVVFYKNAHGLAVMRPSLRDSSESDSGIGIGHGK